ncbi:MAG: hypothetical protein ACI8YQ_004697, partial [Polaribacter sp.]
ERTVLPLCSALTMFSNIRSIEDVLHRSNHLHKSEGIVSVGIS